MTTLLGPPELFSAWSCAVDGQDPREPLPPGIHLRVLAGLPGTFPLAPLAVFKIPAVEGSITLHFSDERRNPVSIETLGQLRTAYAQPEYTDSQIERTVAFEFFSVHPGDFQAELLDPRGRLIAERDTVRFLFSAPAMSQFRFTGSDLQALECNRYVVPFEQALLHGEPTAVALLGLPFDGMFPWYVGVQSRDDAIDRVSRGAPARLSVMDQPVGPFSRLSPQDETGRIESLLSSFTFGGGLESILAAMVAEGPLPPWLRVMQQQIDRGSNQFADLPQLGSLQMTAIDPGIARFLGFADRIDGSLPASGPPDALAVVGLMAMDPDLASQWPHLTGWLGNPNPEEAGLIDLAAHTIQQLSGQDVSDELNSVIQGARRNFSVRAMVAVTVPAPAWLPPTPPVPSIVDHHWQASDGVTASSLYRATFAFSGAPLGALAAVARQEDGQWTSTHDFLPVSGGSVPTRAVPRMFGSESDPSGRVRAQLSAGTPGPLEEAGLLAEENLTGELAYRFWAADLFGRFGGPAETTIEPPPRPGPPPPVLRYHLDLLSDGLDDLPPDGPLSPGSLQLTVVPAPPLTQELAPDDPRLASAIVVPGLSGLPAGSLPIQTLTVALDGVQHTVDATSPGLTVLPPMPLEGLQPQTSKPYTLTATFADSAGTLSSSPAVCTFTVTDKRPLAPVQTGLGLIWTSTPGPGPDVQLKLAWRTAPGTLHRVYVIDQQGLGLTGADLAEPVSVPGADPSRARVAAAGARKVLSGASIDRTRFRLLTDTATADSSGLAVLETTFPRSLQNVQFLRITPVSSAGAEAPFDNCGIVPVAVPDSRRPARPQLNGRTDPAAGIATFIDPATGFATFTVTADGLDGVALRRDEPGLFDPTAGPAAAPLFRIRRAVSAVPDPIYARQVAEGQLVYDASQEPRVVFTSNTAQDTNDGRGLEPFVRYVYWAEVSLPPERRLPPDVSPLNGAVTAFDPANATDHPRPMSLPSAPRTLMRVPETPPAAPPAESIQVTRTVSASGGIDLAIAITDPPVAHAMAVGPYQLAIWPQWAGQPILPVTITEFPVTLGISISSAGLDLPTNTGLATVTLPAPDPPGTLASPVTLCLAYVDPASRLSTLTSITVR